MTMFNTIVRAGAVGAGAEATSRYGSGSDQMMRLLAAPASSLQHSLLPDWTNANKVRVCLENFIDLHWTTVLLFSNKLR
jgi:hypothetical protein